MVKNGVMMQFFEWYLPTNMLWKQLKNEAKELSNNGITAIWIPPAYKGSSGVNDVGYGVYDLYDLGEFDQKGTIPTKYGTKEELLQAVEAVHESRMDLYADIVLNHMMGADEHELVKAQEVNSENRLEDEGDIKKIHAWTHFSFPGRNNKYSDFQWHWYHFSGIDWDEKRNEDGVFLFKGKGWDQEVDQENGNFDYLMGADLDHNHPEVNEELKKWGRWFLDTTRADGFRIDAVKHIDFKFYNDWLTTLRYEKEKELFAVAEYWSPELSALEYYLEACEGSLSLFDVPLHFNFLEASQEGGTFDMRTIFDNTLTKVNPSKSVTFVDNHDTQPGQSLESWIPDWFKPLAYSLILLREQGYPCIFYGDYYGIPHNEISSKSNILNILLNARRNFSHGKQNDYFDHENIIGWTREGNQENPNSGLAVLLTNSYGGLKTMYVGNHFKGTAFYDITGNIKEEIIIKEDGCGDFFVNDGSLSVWLPKYN